MAKERAAEAALHGMKGKNYQPFTAPPLKILLAASDTSSDW